MEIIPTTTLDSGLTNNDIAALVEHDRVHTSLYTSPELFDLEIDRIFNKTWVWVAHESEIPDAGSFKSSMVGKQPVIVVRDRKRNINVLLNRCRHRAATVCEHQKGKTNNFVCPYHGWGYGLDGALRGVPHPESYEDTLDKANLGLVKLRTESYGGLVFATFNDDIEPLDTFLGPAKNGSICSTNRVRAIRLKRPLPISSVSRVTGKFSSKIPPMVITSLLYTSPSSARSISRLKICSTLWTAVVMSKTSGMVTVLW